MRNPIRRFAAWYRNRPIPAGFYEQPVGAATMQRILEQCGILPGTETAHLRVLDFGCGAGRYTRGFAAVLPPERITGVEVDWPLLSKLGGGAGGGPYGVWTSADHAVLPFAAASFDIVFSSNVIEHIPHALYQIYLREIFRVLKPGGVFAVGAPNYPAKRAYDVLLKWRQVAPAYRLYYLLDDPTHINRQSVLKVERDLAAAGFRRTRLEPGFILFQQRIPALRRPGLRQRLRFLGEKFFGITYKP